MNYFDHAAHKTRKDKTQSATSWPLVEFKREIDSGVIDRQRLEKWIANCPLHTYNGKPAGEK